MDYMFELCVGVATIICAAPTVFGGVTKLWQRCIRPCLTFQYFDTFPIILDNGKLDGYRADYKLIIKSWFNNVDELSILLMVKPLQFQASDFKVKILLFDSKIGRGHMDIIDVSETNLDDRKEVKFKIPTNTLFRIVVLSGGGHVGSLLPDHYGLNILSEGAKVKTRGI